MTSLVTTQIHHPLLPGQQILFGFHHYAFLWLHLLGKGDLMSIPLPQEGKVWILVYGDPMLLPLLG